MFAEGSDPEKLIQPTAWPGLDLLPADESIRSLDRQLDRLGKKKRLAKLTEGLGKNYDRIIFDCLACDLLAKQLWSTGLHSQDQQLEHSIAVHL